jgi:hypothetical protein
MALKLTILVNHHDLHQQTRVHNSVKVFDIIMPLFYLENTLNMDKIHLLP